MFTLRAAAETNGQFTAPTCTKLAMGAHVLTQFNTNCMTYESTPKYPFKLMECSKKLTALERSNLFLLRRGESRAMEPWKTETQARGASEPFPTHQPFVQRACYSYRIWETVAFVHVHFMYYLENHVFLHLNTQICT